MKEQLRNNKLREIYNKIPRENPKPYISDNEIFVSFVRGPRVEIKGSIKKKYRVQFIDSSNHFIVHQGVIETNHWIKASREWFTKWKIRVFEVADSGNTLIFEHIFNAIGKRVYIHFDSSSLGDTIAWFPYVMEYSRIHNCKVICSTFWNDLFKSRYPSIEFVLPGSTVNDLYAMYVVGWWDKDNEDENLRPSNPRTKPLQQTSSDILGIPYTEIVPELFVKDANRKIEEKYVCISTESTAGAKYWLRDNGWQDVIDYLNSIGYKVVITQKEPNKFRNVIDMAGNKPIDVALNLINNCEFLISLASGLAWVGWALNKKVIMIAGFTEEYTEFHKNHFRVINKNVCYGCWNDPTAYPFDKGDWFWCPRLKGTDRHFECSKQISVENVIEVINKVRSI